MGTLVGGQFVEVIRIVQELDSRSVAGNSTWYFIARGSGIWLSVGRLCVATTRSEFVKHVNGNRCDSVQNAGGNVLQREIVDLRSGPWGACGDSRYLRTGWLASKPCHCNPRLKLLNRQPT